MKGSSTNEAQSIVKYLSTNNEFTVVPFGKLLRDDRRCDSLTSLALKYDLTREIITLVALRSKVGKNSS